MKYITRPGFKRKSLIDINKHSLRSLRTLLMKKNLSYRECYIILYNIEPIMSYYDIALLSHSHDLLTLKEQLFIYSSISMFFDRLTIRLENDSIMFKAFSKFVHSNIFAENCVAGMFGNNRDIFTTWIGDNIKRDGETRYPKLVSYLKKLKLKNKWG